MVPVKEAPGENLMVGAGMCVAVAELHGGSGAHGVPGESRALGVAAGYEWITLRNKSWCIPAFPFLKSFFSIDNR